MELKQSSRIQPLVARKDMDDNILNCPNFSDCGYTPKGWKEVNRYVVHNGSFGKSFMSLNIGEFLQKVREGFGYAIVEEHGLGVWVAEYQSGFYIL